MKPKITSRKYQGNDAYSWAIFVNGVPVVTGLSRNEVPYYKKKISEKYNIKPMEKVNER